MSVQAQAQLRPISMRGQARAWPVTLSGAPDALGVP